MAPASGCRGAGWCFAAVDAEKPRRIKIWIEAATRGVAPRVTTKAPLRTRCELNAAPV